MNTENERRVFRIEQNLSDAGCCQAQIVRFLELEEQQKRREQYRLLEQHRAALLDALHRDQYKIDCLDYMVFTMQKEDRE